MPNRLANETSPYLLQHKDNPVDWYPWGSEALQQAKDEKKPIFLSIGYSACHWCHVMEHESFESEKIAAILNEHFVCIKVDREERPDLDQIYMNATQLMTGRGGWPMSVFLTPDLKPFYTGTYWPPQAARGMPGFDQVLVAVSKAWKDNREDVLETADQVTASVDELSRSDATDELNLAVLNSAAQHFRLTFDGTHGGFGGAPKFPSPMALQFLLRDWYRRRDDSSLHAVEFTLDKMAAGGIYDHLGGGFARYSVDDRWLVPHFEKMLYDNAQLATTYVEAFQATGKQEYARVVRETLDYVLRDMTDTGGGFYSTEDADSEGVEGKFYVWTPAQLQEVLGADAAATFAKVYDVTEAGNFEHGQSILNLPKTIAQQAQLLGREEDDLKQELAESRTKLFQVREQRVHPHKDDKVIVAWNGLMIDAMARAGAVLGEERYLQAARNAADFLLKDLRNSEERLLHTWRHGTAKIDAYLDDYGCLTNGLISLYEASGEGHYLDEAATLMDVVFDKFQDKQGHAFFYTAADQEELIVRSKDFADSAVPSGNGILATALARMALFTGEDRHRSAAESIMLATMKLIGRAPSAAAQTLLAMDMHLGPSYELVLACDMSQDSSRQAFAQLQGCLLPRKVLAVVDRQQTEVGRTVSELCSGKQMQGDSPTLYICEGFTCRAPAQGVVEIEHALDELK